MHKHLYWGGFAACPLGPSSVTICTEGWAWCQCAFRPCCHSAALPQASFCRVGKVSLRLRDVVSSIAHEIKDGAVCWEHMVQDIPTAHYPEGTLLLACRMGKVPVRLREVVYTLSPFETTVLNGLWKDLPQKAHRKISEVSCMAWLWLPGQGSGL